MKVLLAEDDEIFRFVLSSQLLGLGHEVIAVADGPSVFSSLAKGFWPDLILLDWFLPGEDGIEVCRKLRSDVSSARIHLVMLSGNSTPSAPAEALAAGADAFLEKPCPHDQLKACLQNLELRRR